MNTAKWDAIAERFERGELVPANGLGAWRDQAFTEAATIRRILPLSVSTLLEVGCGVGRLTPHLAIMFSRVIAIDTSPICRRATAFACMDRRNVEIRSPDESIDADAALVWGNLYDEDWSDEAARRHTAGLCRSYPLVLIQHPRGWTLADSEEFTTGDEWVLLRGKPRHALL